MAHIQREKNLNIVNKTLWDSFFPPSSQFMWTQTTVGNMSDFDIISPEGMKKLNKYICCSEGRMTTISTSKQVVQTFTHARTHTFWRRCLATGTHRVLLWLKYTLPLFANSTLLSYVHMHAHLHTSRYHSWPRNTNVRQAFKDCSSVVRNSLQQHLKCKNRQRRSWAGSKA